MLPVAKSFIQHDPVRQHSTEFSGLGTTSNYNSLAEFFFGSKQKSVFSR